MGRPLRAASGGYVYHVLNRANARLRLFEKAGDYDALCRVLAEAQVRHPARLLAYCVMPNHWHLVLWPRHDGEWSRLVGWLTLTHPQRLHAHRHTAGGGHLYQGRFQSFPVQEDDHLLTVHRYVERNPLRAGLVRRARDWRWSSLAAGDGDGPGPRVVLADWPVPRPADWAERVERPETEAELAALRRSLPRGAAVRGGRLGSSRGAGPVPDTRKGS